MAYFVFDCREQIDMASRRVHRIGIALRGRSHIAKLGIIERRRIDEPAFALGVAIDEDASAVSLAKITCTEVANFESQLAHGCKLLRREATTRPAFLRRSDDRIELMLRQVGSCIESAAFRKSKCLVCEYSTRRYAARRGLQKTSGRRIAEPAGRGDERGSTDAKRSGSTGVLAVDIVFHAWSGSHSGTHSLDAELVYRRICALLSQADSGKCRARARVEAAGSIVAADFEIDDDISPRGSRTDLDAIAAGGRCRDGVI